MRYILLAIAALAAACGPSPAVLSEGDACDVCRMVITDTRFGGQVELSTGRTRSFDAIECLVEYLAADSNHVSRVLVSDFETGSLIEASSARFIRASTVASPMGRGVIAVGSAAPDDSLAARYGGIRSDFATLRQLTQAGHGHAR